MGVVAPATANAAPPAPAAPTQIFAETFENVAGNTLVGLNTYTGTQGATYSADPFWLSVAACNGFVLQGNTPIPFTGAGAGCVNNASQPQNRLVDLAGVLGAGSADPASNRAVAAYTQANGPGNANLLLQSSNSGIALVKNHFYVASLDVAEVNCFAPTNSTLDFGLRLASGEVMIAGAPAVACDTGTAVQVNGHEVKSGTFFSPSFKAPAAGAADLVVRNRSDNGAGNDFAYDNLRFYDATPTLHKAFDAASVEVGVPTTMRLTVVNTSELSAKNGWSFTDKLPKGMTVAGNGNVQTNCATVSASGSTVTVTNGALAQGAQSCSIAVDVVLGAGGAFTNTITGMDGLAGTPSATIRALVPHYTLTKTAKPASVTEAGQKVTYTFVVKNDGDLPLHDVAVTDPGPQGGSGKMSAVTCPEITELAVGKSLKCTAVYTAGKGDLTGKPLKNVASASAVSPSGAILSETAKASLDTVEPTGTLANTGGENLAGFGIAAGLLLAAGAGTILLGRKRAMRK